MDFFDPVHPLLDVLEVVHQLVRDSNEHLCVGSWLARCELERERDLLLSPLSSSSCFFRSSVD